MSLTLAFAWAAPLRAQGGAQSMAIEQSIGSYFEDNIYRGGVEQLRLPLTWTLGLGRPRFAQLEVEPSLGWHVTHGSVDTSGLSYTRMRVYWFLGARNRISLGPDFEMYLKTDTYASVGLGYTRLMPGVQLQWQMPGKWRSTFRARYEVTTAEDPGVKGFRRIVFRPSLFAPPFGRWTFWARADFSYDLQDGHGEYNLEWLAAIRAGHRRRLTLFAEPRLYIGPASRVKNLWRLRGGFGWSLGDLVTLHAGGN